jgi:predicted negative regulator of RcsB-dependent stress response
MANHLDLEEQEQLDQLKHFWQQYGNLITWLLIAVLSCVAAWNGYQWWQRSQSAQASAMFDEVERVVRGGDVSKAERAFADMRERFAATAYTQQAGLMVAKLAYDAGKADVARSSLEWMVDKSADKSYASIARLRLSALMMDAKEFDGALKLLNKENSSEFAPLVADRKGDIYSLQGKRAEAIAEYEKAFKGLEERVEYRRLVEVKLNALGKVMNSANATSDVSQGSGK